VTQERNIAVSDDVNERMRDTERDLDREYREMARDIVLEREAMEWIEAGNGETLDAESTEADSAASSA